MCVLIVLSIGCLVTGLVPNEGQYPIATGEEVSLLSTGPMCRYSEDLLPLLKIYAGQDGSNKTRLDEQVIWQTL